MKRKAKCVMTFIVTYFLFWMLIANICCWITSIPYGECWFTWAVGLTQASIGWIPSLIGYLITDNILGKDPKKITLPARQRDFNQNRFIVNTYRNEVV